MKLKTVQVNDILFRRPGNVLIKYTAKYDSCTKKGVVKYDLNQKKFLNHTSQIKLLSYICRSISNGADNSLVEVE